MKNIFLILISMLFVSCSLLDIVNEEVVEIHTTQGEELMDLKKALDSGAITQAEYDKLKTDVMNRDYE